MFLKYFKLDKPLPNIRPGQPKRDWMDATPLQFAYRCLPMTIAGSAGWEVLNPVAFSAVWSGKRRMESIKIDCKEAHPIAVSHFGSGLLTFKIGHFRTEKDKALWIGGPPNTVKDGIQPLAGIAETDWMPMSVSMTWKFTRKRQRVYFEKDEPICFIFPIDLSMMEQTQPTIENASDYPEIEREFLEWRESRDRLNESQMVKKDGMYESKWQKIYHRGTKVDGTPGDTVHRTKMKLSQFNDMTSKPNEQS